MQAPSVMPTGFCSIKKGPLFDEPGKRKAYSHGSSQKTGGYASAVIKRCGIVTLRSASGRIPFLEHPQNNVGNPGDDNQPYRKQGV